jgi:ribonuclease HI
MGVGVMVRDTKGVLATMYTTVPFIIDPTIAEAISAWKAIVFCKNLGLQYIFLEGDTMKIVNNFRQENSCWNQYDQLIEDTRIMLNSLQSWVVGHVGREANEAAHCFTKFAF